MPSYLNPHAYDLHLVGEDGQKVRIRRGKVLNLPVFFDKYVNKQFLRRVDGPKPIASVPEPQPKLNSVAKRRTPRLLETKPKRVRTRSQVIKAAQADGKKVVGRRDKVNATRSFEKLLSVSEFPISNGVGIGILSYNRATSLQRLIQSIIKYTDLGRTTVFISDDASDDPQTKYYLNWLAGQSGIVVLRNEQRLGIAGNSNRLLRCLDRFPHKLLLNDDVEILSRGWDLAYPGIMAKTGLHHLCYRQPGVYGATLGTPVIIGDTKLHVVDSKPHGAVMAFDVKAYDAVGHFDKSFGLYGCEHVDWSNRISKSGIQPPGFYDFDGSQQFFKIHAEQSAVQGRTELLRAARNRYESIDQNRLKVDPDPSSQVPTISYVIPFRDTERHAAIFTVLNNIRAQQFPCIKIIMTEEDAVDRFSASSVSPARYVFTSSGGHAFCKSAAFNAGVALVDTDKVVLHDADTLAPSGYTQEIYQTLDEVDACHFGEKIFYASEDYSKHIVVSGSVSGQIDCEYICNYYEGGSLACRTKVYWQVGGFSEEFVGYGVEDCDFYARLAGFTNWREHRHLTFLHLYHGRSVGWQQHHARNKTIEKQLLTQTIAERVTRQVARLSSKYPQHYG